MDAGMMVGGGGTSAGHGVGRDNSSMGKDYDYLKMQCEQAMRDVQVYYSVLNLSSNNGSPKGHQSLVAHSLKAGCIFTKKVQN